MTILPDMYPCKPDIFEATYSPALAASPNTTASGAADRPEALKLASILRGLDTRHYFGNKKLVAAADELERLHALAASAPVAPTQPDWRELCRRLYVELFHCDKQMTCSLNEDGEPIWRTGTEVRDVLSDAKAALEANTITREAAPVAPTQPIVDLLQQLEDSLVEWSDYVTADDAPRTLREHASPHIKLLMAEFARLNSLADPARIVEARYRCRKCGEQNNIEFNSARIVTHRPDGSARDPRDIASDPEGKLMHSASEPLRAAPVAPAPQPAPVKIVRDFRWDSAQQHHVPTLLLEFEPVPANSPIDAKGWNDRDDVAIMLAAAPKASPAELPDAVAHYGGVFTDEQLGMKPAPLQQGEYLPLQGLAAYLRAEAVYVNSEVDDELPRDILRRWADDVDRAARGAAQAAPAPVTHPVIAGALFDFLGYLTTLKTPVSFGSSKEASPAVEHLQIWAKLRNLQLDEAKVMDWSKSAAPVAEDADPLQGAANWLIGSGAVTDDIDLAKRLSIGRNRAERLLDAARAQAAQPEGGAK